MLSRFVGSTNVNRVTLLLLGVLVALAVLFSFNYSLRSLVHAQTAGVSLNGYAWSDNIGWIQMYSVVVGSDASTLTGYGWSDNIGWVSFNASQLSGCPSGTCNARIVGGALRGWARACAGTVAGTCTGASRTDGWDGWISLSGTGYGPSLPALQTSGLFTGYAWGSDVVGWIDFSGVSVGAQVSPTTALTITANPTRVRTGGTTTLTWNVTGMSFCGISGSDGSEPALTTAANATTGSHNATATVNQATVYTLTCTDAAANTYRGRVSVSITQTVIEL